MDSKEFTRNCVRLARHAGEIQYELAEMFGQEIDFIHGAIGVATEAGELLDVAKKLAVYGKLIDNTNVKEEVGDVLHYLAYICDALNFTFEDAMEANVAKLAKRYPEGFSTEKAINRDTQAEREVLEDHRYTNGHPDNLPNRLERGNR